MILGIIGSRRFGAIKDPDFDIWVISPEHRKMIEDHLNEIKKLKEIKEVTSGGAKGPDSIGERWARSNGIKCKIYIARTWENDFETAAFLRNTKIAERCTILVSFWDGKSRGTLDTMKKAVALGKKVYVCNLDGELTRWKG